VSISIFEYVETYFLLLMRVAGIFSSAPIIGSETMPTQVRLASAFVFSLILLPIQAQISGVIHIPGETAVFALVVVKEVLLGILLGFMANFTIEGIKLAGEIIGMQLGFGIVSVIDPESQQEESIIGSLNFMIFILVFLTVNGHHMLVRAVAQSLEIVPLGMIRYSSSFIEEIMDKAPQFIIVSFKIATPVILPVIIVTIVLGIISKAVPRFEVFIISFPVNITLGFLVFIFYMPDLVRYMTYLMYSGIFDEITRMLYILK